MTSVSVADFFTREADAGLGFVLEAEHALELFLDGAGGFEGEFFEAAVETYTEDEGENDLLAELKYAVTHWGECHLPLPPYPKKV